jgi:hypothetical protein
VVGAWCFAAVSSVLIDRKMLSTWMKEVAIAYAAGNGAAVLSLAGPASGYDTTSISALRAGATSPHPGMGTAPGTGREWADSDAAEWTAQGLLQPSAYTAVGVGAAGGVAGGVGGLNDGSVGRVASASLARRGTLRTLAQAAALGQVRPAGRGGGGWMGGGVWRGGQCDPASR